MAWSRSPGGKTTLTLSPALAGVTIAARGYAVSWQTAGAGARSTDATTARRAFCPRLLIFAAPRTCGTRTGRANPGSSFQRRARHDQERTAAAGWRARD